MSYNGFEIDMLSLGDADCLLVTRWIEDQPQRVLIDGGYQESAEEVRQFLERFSITYVDHLVCTHPHVDHTGGLIELVKDPTLEFGMAWMHMPWNYVSLSDISAALSRSTSRKRAEVVEKSLQSINTLYNALEDRGVPVQQPFEGNDMAFLKVCGPSEDFYRDFVDQFADADKLESSQQAIELSESLLNLKGIAAKKASESLLADPTTSPENESSVVLGAVYNSEKFLFTADAGVRALTEAKNAYDLAECAWMQIPHHGSWRNVTTDLIEYFRPSTAFVSAAGNEKHPRDAVVNAFKEAGANVYSTHYPSSGNKWHHRGQVPERPQYTSATPLWDAGR